MVQNAAVYDLVGTDVKLNVFEIFHFDPLTSLQLLLLHSYFCLSDITHLQETWEVKIRRLMPEACGNLSHPQYSFKACLDTSLFKDLSSCRFFQRLISVNETARKLPLRRHVPEPKLFLDQQETLAVRVNDDAADTDRVISVVRDRIRSLLIEPLGENNLRASRIALWVLRVVQFEPTLFD